MDSFSARETHSTKKIGNRWTLTILEVNPAAVGRLIALFERAVGLYAFLVNINAYHQPGVEAGKASGFSRFGLSASRSLKNLSQSKGFPKQPPN
jgi:glucose-6-phosphate isomerase